MTSEESCQSCEIHMRPSECTFSQTTVQICHKYSQRQNPKDTITGFLESRILTQSFGWMVILHMLELIFLTSLFIVHSTGFQSNISGLQPHLPDGSLRPFHSRRPNSPARDHNGGHSRIYSTSILSAPKCSQAQD